MKTIEQKCREVGGANRLILSDRMEWTAFLYNL